MFNLAMTLVTAGIKLLGIVAARHSQELRTVETAERVVTSKVGTLPGGLDAFALQLQQALAAANEKVLHNLSIIEGTFNQWDAMLSQVQWEAATVRSRVAASPAVLK